MSRSDEEDEERREARSVQLRQQIQPVAVTSRGVRVISYSTGASMIAEERYRQVGAEGYGGRRDDEYGNAELARAAVAYLLVGLDNDTPDGVISSWPPYWPWSRESFKPTPDDRIRELIKAGALIAAEIDRRLRAKAVAEGTAVR